MLNEASPCPLRETLADCPTAGRPTQTLRTCPRRSARTRRSERRQGRGAARSEEQGWVMGKSGQRRASEEPGGASTSWCRSARGPRFLSLLSARQTAEGQSPGDCL